MNVSISELPEEFAAILIDNMTITNITEMVGNFSEFQMPLNTSAEFTEMAEWMNDNAGTLMETVETVVQDCSNITMQLMEEQAMVTDITAQFDNL